MEENLPVGTTIAQFSALDVDAGNTLTFEWAELAEDNPWFILEADGQLRTREVLDYEKNASHEISIRVVDQDGASSVQDFEIRVRDVFRPIVRTVHRNWEDEVVLTGNVLETGGESMLFERGFVLGQNPDPVTTDSDVEVFMVPGQAGIYEYFLPMNSEFNNWYFRAYAKNGEGISYGSSHRLTMPMDEIMNEWLNAVPMEGLSGWWKSPWFGEFYMTNNSGWIMHTELGWIFVLKEPKNNGVWVWVEQIGWAWTSKGTYPFFFRNDSDSWLFFHGKGKDRLLFYDYQSATWGANFPLDESEKNIPVQEEEVEIEEPKVLARWANADPMVEAQNWWSSPWFGEFYMTNDSGWIMHAKLGWVFSMGHDDGNGVWLWQNNLGWLWTKDGVYPYIFQHTLMDWLFFHGNSNNQILFYNYQETNWLLIGR